jgi:hypothetical protein
MTLKAFCQRLRQTKTFPVESTSSKSSTSSDSSNQAVQRASTLPLQDSPVSTSASLSTYQRKQNMFTLLDLYSIDASNYPTAQEYKTAFEDKRQKLIEAGRPSSETEDVILFVHGAGKRWPLWAEGMRLKRRLGMSLGLGMVMDDLVEMMGDGNEKGKEKGGVRWFGEEGGV